MHSSATPSPQPRTPAAAQRPVFSHYRIDRTGRLIDGWLSPEACRTTHVESDSMESWVGEVIWDAISDDTLCSLQQLLVERLFTTGRAISLPMRCDAPDHAIWLTFKAGVSLENESTLKITTMLDQASERPWLRLLGPEGAREGAMLRSCAWCARLDLPAVGWMDIDEALLAHPELNAAPLPPVTHGVCETCEARMRRELEAL